MRKNRVGKCAFSVYPTVTRSEAVQLLEASGVPDALRDVQRLERFAGDNPVRFADAVQARANRQPISHIIGTRAFWAHDFKVTPQVLDPRPETEVLVERALAEPFTKVLDLGTGSGCIVISLLAERCEARGVGTDISEAAVLVAGDNAARIGVADRLILPVSEWYDDIGGRFDLIVSNPPYIAVDDMAGLDPEVRDHEPWIALTDEADGLSAYHKIAAGAVSHLTPGGRLLVEIGPTQADAVQALFRAAGLEDCQVHLDLDGRDRVVQARAPSTE